MRLFKRGKRFSIIDLYNLILATKAQSREGINIVSDYLTTTHDNSVARLAAFDTIRHRFGSIVYMNFTIANNSHPGTVKDVNVRK